VKHVNPYLTLKKKLIENAGQSITPVVGEFELTAKCNFHCPMCYVADNKTKSELSTNEWKELLKEAVEAGLIYALLTGGEVLTRPDFVMLYEYLFDLGVRITIYTNGHQLTDALIDVLKKRPPELIEITLYGGTDATYQKVTESKAGFSVVKSNILKLKANNLPVSIRAIPIPEVAGDLDLLIEFARETGLVLGHFLYVGPSRARDYQNRLTPEALIEFETRIRSAFPEAYRSRGRGDDTDKTCQALRSGYYVNHRGYMQPCAIMPVPGRKVESGRFLETFHKLSAQWVKLRNAPGCQTCSLKNDCIQCPARRYLEGDIGACAEYLHRHAQLRRKVKNHGL